MNCEFFNLKELVVEQYQIREVLRCILHTIMFNRALGLVRPRDVDSELFEITYVQCGDPIIEKKIEEKIDLFCSWVEKHPSRKGQVCLSFYEKRSKQGAWFSSKVERLSWEHWALHLHVPDTPPPEEDADERARRQAVLEADLREVLFQVLATVGEKKAHIPPVVSSDTATFPFEITIPSSSDSAFGMDMIKRMLQTSPPQMLG